MNPTPKDGGLPRFADEARALGLTADAATYPVKKRGQKRQLIPNQAGIEWLEEQTAADCKIYHTSEPSEGLCYTYAVGVRNKNYPRPMFQVIHDSNGFCTFTPGRACPCGDFSRTWNCPDHEERKWNADGHYWEAPTGARHWGLAQTVQVRSTQGEHLFSYETEADDDRPF